MVKTGGKKKEDEKEVRAFPPPFIVFTPPEERDQIDRERIRVEERIRVIDVARRVGVFFVGLMVIVGTLLIASSIYMVMTGQVVIPVERLFLASALVFLGVINIISGLFLMVRG